MQVKKKILSVSFHIVNLYCKVQQFMQKNTTDPMQVWTTINIKACKHLSTKTITERRMLATQTEDKGYIFLFVQVSLWAENPHCKRGAGPTCQPHAQDCNLSGSDSHDWVGNRGSWEDNRGNWEGSLVSLYWGPYDCKYNRGSFKSCHSHTHVYSHTVVTESWVEEPLLKQSGHGHQKLFSLPEISLQKKITKFSIVDTTRFTLR